MSMSLMLQLLEKTSDEYNEELGLTGSSPDPETAKKKHATLMSVLYDALNKGIYGLRTPFVDPGTNVDPPPVDVDEMAVRVGTMLAALVRLHDHNSNNLNLAEHFGIEDSEDQARFNDRLSKFVMPLRALINERYNLIR